MADHTLRNDALWLVGWMAAILAVVATIYVIANVAPKSGARHAAVVRDRQCYYEELAQPRIYQEPGIHEAPTYHLQAHHDQILIQLRRIEEKVDRLLNVIEKGEGVVR